MSLSEVHLAELRDAKRRLEVVPYHVKLSNMVGKPLELVFDALPAVARNQIGSVTSKAMETSVKWASTGMKNDSKKSRGSLHKLIVGASGAAGGALGLAGAAVEMPFSTTIMLRSIAEIAREQGHEVTLQRTRLECLSVFAMGGRSDADDAAESAYLAVRAAQARMIKNAVQYANSAATQSGSRKMAEEAVPVLIRVMNEIAKRFGRTVSNTLAAKTVPVIGAATGAAINTLFLDYYQSVAKGHFTVLRLEGIYGKEEVAAAYSRLEI